MSIKVTVPELGESVVEATVGRWHKQEGDRVTAGETLVELETDKVNLEVSAQQAGVLGRIERREGEDVRIGDVLAVIDEVTEAVGTGRRAYTAPTPPATPTADVPPPPLSEVREVRVEQAAEPATAPVQAEPRQADGDTPGSDKATPVARRMADEHGVDLRQVPATGPGDRLTRQDVQSYLAGRQPGPQVPPASLPVAPPPPQAARPAATRPELEERVRLSRRRRTIAQRLVEAQHTAAMLTTFNEIDMGAVMEIRQRRRDSFQERHGIRLGFMSFFVKAVIGALKGFPQLNAEIQGEDLVLKHYYDIGIAVGTPEGLVVPVLRNADRISFGEIERAIKEFSEKASSGTLSLEDLRGGTFTITNGGVFGSLLSTPILNPPQVGILGMHKIEERPIAVKGQVVIRPMMYVALSYDHRIVDGREAVQFLVRVKELIEDPESLLLEG